MVNFRRTLCRLTLSNHHVELLRSDHINQLMNVILFRVSISSNHQINEKNHVISQKLFHFRYLRKTVKERSNIHKGN